MVIRGLKYSFKNKMFTVTEGRDVSAGDEVNAVTNVVSVLSVNG